MKLTTWIKGIFIGALISLLPLAWAVDLKSDWRPWWLFGLIVILIGSQPDTSYVAADASKANKKDKGSRTIILIAGYLSVLVPIGVFLWQSKHPAGSCPCSWPKAVGYAAGIIGFLALLFRAWSIHVLGRFFTSDVQVSAEHKLCKKGPYSFIRHPSYTGSFFFFLSIPFVLGVVLWIPMVLLLWLFVYFWRIRAEEKALEEHFGDEYLQYKAKTYALLPPLW